MSEPYDGKPSNLCANCGKRTRVERQLPMAQVFCSVACFDLYHGIKPWGISTQERAGA